MYREYLTRNTRTRVENVEYVHDERIKEDGYALTVTNEGKATVRHHGVWGKRYADEALRKLTDGEGNTLVGEFEDYPSFPLRGIIEGYYGKPYTWAERRDIIDFLASHKMNAYFYAPKDDRYHRDLWRVSYPEDQIQKIAELKKYADEKNILFYYCLSPGADFQYTREEDYEILLRKFREVEALGIEEFAILFDDISSRISDEGKARFSSAGEAHSYIANFLNARLKHKHKLMICPTNYSQNYDTPYRKDMRKYLDKDVQVIWTGYNVIAEAIPLRDCVEVKKNFARELILWDNYPVNDYVPQGRIYMDAISNRTTKIAEYHSGAMSNTSELWESSKFMLCSFAEWMWNAENYDPEGAYTRTLDELVGKDEKMRFFVGLNRTSSLRIYPTNASRFDKEDWGYLDGYYKKLRSATLHTKKHCNEALRREWAGLFRYGLLECRLYKALRGGKELNALLRQIKKEKYHFADQSIFEYIAKKGLGEDISRAGKPCYWKTDETAGAKPW